MLESGAQWHPQDLDTNGSSSTITHNSSPWTYENDSLNPNLQPTNSQSRKRLSQTSSPGASSLPPYHPDYREGENVYNSDGYESSDEQESAPRGKIHIRRGSEGYEVRPEGREEMLRQYLSELGEQPGRYLRYIPQPDSEESEGSLSEDVPLARRREMSGGY